MQPLQQARVASPAEPASLTRRSPGDADSNHNQNTRVKHSCPRRRAGRQALRMQGWAHRHVTSGAGRATLQA